MTESFFKLSSQPASAGSPFMQLLSTPRFQFVLLLTLTAFLCTIKLDNGGIMAFDECFYAQKAKEIVTSGDWLTQRLAGKADHLNPWLHMWTIAASYKLFGVSDWAARFPTCVETILIVLLTYLLAQWILDAPFFGLLSSLMLLANDFFYRFARKAHMDHLVTLLFLAAVTMYILGRHKNRLWFLGMGVSIGLAILTKSVLGLFPPDGHCRASPRDKRLESPQAPGVHRFGGAGDRHRFDVVRVRVRAFQRGLFALPFRMADIFG